MALSETEHAWLEGLIQETDGGRMLSKWEQGFVQDQAQRLEEHGENMFLSPKQWAVLIRIADKVGYALNGAGDDE